MLQIAVGLSASASLESGRALDAELGRALTRHRDSSKRSCERPVLKNEGSVWQSGRSKSGAENNASVKVIRLGLHAAGVEHAASSDHNVEGAPSSRDDAVLQAEQRCKRHEGQAGQLCYPYDSR